MIHILLVILKIMGIVLLVILGLLLGILLAVLFIPVRYKAEGNYHGQLLLSVCATWFFHILVFGAVYEGEGMACSLKVLGFRLWHNREKDPARDLEDGLETILGDEEQSLYEELQQDEEHYRRNTGRPIRMDGPMTAGHGRNNRMTASPAGNRLMAHNSMGNTREGRTPTGGKAGQRKIKQGLSLTNRGPVSWKK